MIRRHVMLARMSPFAERRQVRVTVSTETLGRDNLIVVTAGISLGAFRSNPVVLYQHNADWPIARAADIGARGDDLVSLVQFPTQGISPRADEVYGLVAEGVISAVSMGFERAKGEPIDPANPRNGTRITSCELAEFSFVSIPALKDALVLERAGHRDPTMQHSIQFYRRKAVLYARELTAQSPSRRANPPSIGPVIPRQRTAPKAVPMWLHREMARRYLSELLVRYFK